MIATALVGHRALDVTTSDQHHFLFDAARHAKPLLPCETLKRIMQLNKRAGKAKHDVSKDMMMLAGSEKLREQIDMPMPRVLTEVVEAARMDSDYEVNSHPSSERPDHDHARHPRPGPMVALSWSGVNRKLTNARLSSKYFMSATAEDLVSCVSGTAHISPCWTKT